MSSKALPAAIGKHINAGSVCIPGHGNAEKDGGQVAIATHKRGRICIIAKLVIAQPLNEVVLAMPFRNRRRVNVVSLPPSVLAFARQWGAKLWVVRLDGEGICLNLPLAAVEQVGWLKASGGSAEWFVPLQRFKTLPWQSWPFVKNTIVVSEVEKNNRAS